MNELDSLRRAAASHRPLPAPSWGIPRRNRAWLTALAGVGAFGLLSAAPRKKGADEGPPPAPAAAVVPLDVERTYAYGVMLMNAGQYDEAIIEFSKVLAVDPAHAGAQKNIEKSEAAAAGVPAPGTGRGARGTAPTLTKTQMQQLYSIGVDALNRKDYAEAVEMFERILAAKPDHRPSQIRVDQARKALKTAGSAAPVPPAPAAETAAPPPRAEPRTPRAPAAKRAVPKNVKGAASPLTKQEKERIYARGVALLNAGKYAECIPEFEKILAADPAHKPSLIRVKKARAALRGH